MKLIKFIGDRRTVFYGSMELRADAFNNTREIVSRLSSLKAITFVYENSLEILKVYFIKGHSLVNLRDPMGNRISLTVNGDNVSTLIRLARSVRARKDFEAENGSLVIGYRHFDVEFASWDHYSLDEMRALRLLTKLSGSLNKSSDRYPVAEVGTAKFVTRIDYPYDSSAGSLLPYAHEANGGVNKP